MNLQTHYYQSPEGFQLALHCSEPSGKPLLHFLHGNGFSSQIYHPMLSRLSGSFDFVLQDIQGHGESEHGGTFVGWQRSAELCAAAFQSVKQHYPNVPHYAVGHSFGGVVTALWQAQTPMFARLVLLDPVLFPPLMLKSMQLLDLLGFYQNNPLAKRARQRKAQFANYDEAWQYFYRRGLFKSWQDEALHAYLQHALKHDQNGSQLKCQPSREAEIFASYPKELWQQLPKLRQPTHLVLGQQSYPFVHRSARRLCRINTVVSQQTVVGGHCFMQEDPELAASLVRHFLLSNA